MWRIGRRPKGETYHSGPSRCVKGAAGVNAADVGGGGFRCVPGTRERTAQRTTASNAYGEPRFLELLGSRREGTSSRGHGCSVCVLNCNTLSCSDVLDLKRF